MSTGDPARALSALKKRRGVIKRSLTRICNNLKTLEATPDVDHAKQLISKLEDLNKDFKSVHFSIIDLLEEESGDIDREQEILDKHEDKVVSMTLRLQKLVKSSSLATDTGSEKPSARKLARMQRCLQETAGAITSMKEEHVDVPLLEQYQEQLKRVVRCI